MGLSTVNDFKHVDSEMCVYLDDEQLKDLQATLLEILKDVIDICNMNQLTYTLSGGSALGAVRHQGFIPWDDDVDINMPRKDFDKFVPLFLQKYKEKYWVHTPETTKNYNLLLSRIRLKGTSVITREDFQNDECGAFIDIFVMENTFDMPILRYVHGFGSLAFGFLQSCRKFYRDRKELLQLCCDNRNLVRKIRIKVFVGFFTALLPMETWTRVANRWNKLCRNHNSEYVVIPAGRKHFFGELYNRDEMCKTKPFLFEDIYANCPVHVEKYLKVLYGDYMKVPNKEEREKHVFIKPFYLEKM